MTDPTTSVPPDVLERLKTLVGPKGWTDDPQLLAPHLVEWRDRWQGTTPLMLSPADTARTAAVIALCAETGVAVTPQGGNTGLVGGQIPQGEVLLSTRRMRAVRDVDRLDDVMVVEAGLTLAEAHEAAAAVGRRFPLDLASGGSATVGGLISTNAGGTAVLRHGTMRSLVLGLEAVLPDGRIWNGLKRLRKDNTGYDLKQMLIGAEGTLGVITAAALKLSPLLPSRAVAVVALESARRAIQLLARAKDESGGEVEAFELICRLGVDLAVRHLPGVRDPLTGRAPWLALIEIASGRPGAAEAAMEAILAGALEDGLILDAALAQNSEQARSFWALREGQSAAQKPEGAVWKHDVSVPVSRMAQFIDTASDALTARWPGVRIDAFGHVGDGNVHFDVLKPIGTPDADHAALRNEGARLVHDLIASLGGSISAEHGLGTMKTAEAIRYKDSVELAALRALRTALDPKRILNPRVLF